MLADRNLHMFITEDEVLGIKNLYPMAQSVRREAVEPVIIPNGKDEGTAIGYSSAVWDEEEGCYKIWYTPHSDKKIRLAISSDGYNWKKKGLTGDPDFMGGIDNLHVLSAKGNPDPWFRSARFVGTIYYSPAACEDKVNGIYVIRSLDGESWEIKDEPVLPLVGDRSALSYDPIREIYMLTSRPTYPRTEGFRNTVSKPRKIALWESRDLLHFEYQGIVLRADACDREDAQLYGMVPFRYGNIFLGLLEMYYPNIERLDTQLAYSRDGRHWERVLTREPVLPLGGEGSWDSHWVVPTLNPPLFEKERLKLFYIGTSTKHASKDKHRRAVGLASLRHAGWVSLEAGRSEGELVTTPLEAKESMQLEINVSCPSGYFAAEVLDMDGNTISGFESDKSRVEDFDSSSLTVEWDGCKKVDLASNRCMLRFYLYQGSLFSYRWYKV